jgi:DNA-binding transcriptional LysR family regulator
VEFGMIAVSGWITTYLERYPQVRVDADFTGRLVDIVHEGFDLAIRVGPLADSTLAARKLGELRYGLFAAPAYLARRAAPNLPGDLATHDVLVFALADNGQRWHVRAFDRRSGEFRDFVLARLADAEMLPGPINEHELPAQDIQWNRVTELELVPHPADVQHPDTIEAEYGMENGVLKVRARAAIAGYLLRRWNVDCTEDHSLKGGEFHLWLRNRQALYGVTNLILAPGYDGHGDD